MNVFDSKRLERTSAAGRRPNFPMALRLSLVAIGGGTHRIPHLNTNGPIGKRTALFPGEARHQRWERRQLSREMTGVCQLPQLPGNLPRASIVVDAGSKEWEGNGSFFGAPRATADADSSPRAVTARPCSCKGLSGGRDVDAARALLQTEQVKRKQVKNEWPAFWANPVAKMRNGHPMPE